MSRVVVRSGCLVAGVIAVTLWGCGGSKPDPSVAEVRSDLNASLPGRGSGLLWRLPSGELRVWDMASSSDYKEISLGTMDATLWQVAGTGDLNAKAGSDILWRNDRDKTVGIWYVTDTAVSSQSAITANLPTLPITGTYVGDLDGDGVSDVIWTEAVPGGTTGKIYTAMTNMMSASSTVPRST